MDAECMDQKMPCRVNACTYIPKTRNINIICKKYQYQ